MRPLYGMEGGRHGPCPYATVLGKFSSHSHPSESTAADRIADPTTPDVLDLTGSSEKRP